MRMSDCFRGAYFKATDVPPGEELLLTIVDAQMETMPRSSDEKPVLSFRETKQKLVLNDTRGNALAEAFGDDADEWIGQRIVLSGGLTDFGGKKVGCLLVREAPPAPRQEKPNAVPPEDDGGGDVPF